MVVALRKVNQRRYTAVSFALGSSQYACLMSIKTRLAGCHIATSILSADKPLATLPATQTPRPPIAIATGHLARQSSSGHARPVDKEPVAGNQSEQQS